MITTYNLSKSFGKNIILENINLNLRKGRIYGFISKNGSGKTVPFKMILGFMPASNGYAEIDNEKIGKDIDFPKKCGLIIETPGFIDNLSGYDNLKMLSNIKGLIDDSKIKENMKFFGLDFKDKIKVIL